MRIGPYSDWLALAFILLAGPIILFCAGLILAAVQSPLILVFSASAATLLLFVFASRFKRRS
jgi:hypothetical protein